MSPQRLPLFKWLVTFAAVFTVGAVGLKLPSAGAHPTLPLLAGGIAAAACIRWGRRMWPAVLAAGVLIDTWTHQALIASVAVGVGAAGAAVFTAWILERRGFDSGFGRARDVPLFIAAAAIGTMIVPTLGLLGFRLAGDQAAATDLFRWIRWWSNIDRGNVARGADDGGREPGKPGTVSPSIGSKGACGCWPWRFACARRTVLRRRRRRQALDRHAGPACASSWAPSVSVSWSRRSARSSYRRRRGLELRLRPRGLRAATTNIRRARNHLVLGAALTGMGLIITALLAERDRAGLERLAAEHRYAQIFNGSPQPLWVHAPDDAGVSTGERGGGAPVRLEPRGVPVAAGADAGRRSAASRVLPPAAGAGTDGVPEPFETRHRTRDGRVIDVEVWTRDIDLGGQPAELVFACDVTERRAFGSALIDAIANEQRRIGQELHDGLGQELTGLALSARALATRAERERQPIAAGLVQLAALAASCIQAARRIAQGVSPLSDADGNLQGALEALAAAAALGNTVVRFRPRLEMPRSSGPRSAQSPVPDRSGGRAERAQARRRPNHRDRAVGAFSAVCA